MIRILVTAFGAFPGAPVNPTMSIARYLEKRRRALGLTGIEIVTHVLPVVFAGTYERLAGLYASLKPDIVLHLGLAGRRKTISVESRALNRLTILHPDAQRKTSGTMQILPAGDPQRRSRFAVEQLTRTISQAGAPARRSIDAGDYLCNQVLYLSLGLHSGPCGFIHVPRRLRAPRGRREPARPPLAAMARSIEVAVRQMAIGFRNGTGNSG